MAIWRNRLGRRGYAPPTPPSSEEIRETKRALEEARRRLAETREQDTEVTRRVKDLEKLLRTNHIGPKFFDALGIKPKEESG